MWRRELIIALGFAMAWPIAANGQQDVRALRSQILLMQAECIADKLAEFIKGNQNQVGWTTQRPSTGGSIEQRQFDALRLLLQAPAITELRLPKRRLRDVCYYAAVRGQPTSNAGQK